MKKSKQQQRYKFNFQNQLIYQWTESLESITLYIPAPDLTRLNNNQGVKLSKLFQVKINSKNLQVGLKGNPPYLKHNFQGIVDPDQSLWLIQDRQFNDQNKKQVNQQKSHEGYIMAKQIVVQLHKAQKGTLWGCVFKQHKNLNPFEQQNLKKKLMLQRFQQQNPNFDFSSAQFNGKVPDARNFMGGVKYN